MPANDFAPIHRVYNSSKNGCRVKSRASRGARKRRVKVILSAAKDLVDSTGGSIGARSFVAPLLLLTTGPAINGLVAETLPTHAAGRAGQTASSSEIVLIRCDDWMGLEM